MERAETDRDLVVKVQYGDTVRRFVLHATGNSLHMNDFKTKIINIFKFSPDSDVVLTYTDTDGDRITLVNDEELVDAVFTQQLNPLRIYVALNGNSARNTETSPMPGDISHIISPVVEALKSIPEPLGNALSKLSEDFISKAAMSAPVLAEFVEHLSKLGHDHAASGGSSAVSELNINTGEPSKNHFPGWINLQSPNEGEKPETSKPCENVTSNGTPDISINPASLGSNKISENQMADNGTRTTSNNFAPFPTPRRNLKDRFQQRRPASGHAASGSTQTGGFYSASVNSSGIKGPISPPSAGVDLTSGAITAGISHTPHIFGDLSTRVFHRGILCDGCGMYPIVGPRYKSNVKENYDLCNICFSEMGREADYIRIDQPYHYYPRSIREACAANNYSFQNHGMRQARETFESHFVEDVTIQDGTTMATCTPFTKIWKIKNSGSTPWPVGTQLAWIGGDTLGDKCVVDLEIPVKGLAAGDDIDIAVRFTAPDKAGRYISYWRLSSPSGDMFGQRVWVHIEVVSPESDRQRMINLNLPPSGDVCLTDAAAKSEDTRPSTNVSTCASSEKSSGDGYQFVPADNYNKGSNDGKAVPDVSPIAFYPKVNSFSTSTNIDTSRVSSPTVSYPFIGSPPQSPRSLPDAAPLVYFSYHDSPLFPATRATVCVDPPSEDASKVDPAEASLLKDLEEMGFNEVALNKEILRSNQYDLQQSLDDLCSVANWDPLLKELKEMGFSNTELNKKLLVKNSGSIKRVVLDLIAGEGQ